VKIKTITCHNVYNYGASLQAYALVRHLKDLGHTVEIIDYNPSYLSNRYNLWSVSPKWSRSIVLKLMYWLLKVPARLIRDTPRRRAFNHFTKDHLPLTSRTYRTNEELKSDIPQADLFIAGSDQIWNSTYPNGRDPTFYLDFASATSIKASYAASFGTDRLEVELQKSIKAWLTAFDCISVREATGLAILDTIGMSGVQVMDPAFLLTADEWRGLATDKSIRGKYILVYDFENNPAIADFATDLSTRTGLPIVTLIDNPCYACKHRYISNASPWDFLGLIRNGEFIISNSFHGTVFSIIFNKEFFTFGRMNQNVNSRMTDLLSVLGITDRLITNATHAGEIRAIDYPAVNAVLTDRIAHSRAYLRHICEYRRPL